MNKFERNYVNDVFSVEWDFFSTVFFIHHRRHERKFFFSKLDMSITVG